MIIIIMPSGKVKPRSPRENYHLIQNPPPVRDACDTCEVEGSHHPVSIHYRIIVVSLDISNLQPQDGNVLIDPLVKKGDARSNVVGPVIYDLIHIVVQ